MIRRSVLSLSNANIGKIGLLNLITPEMQRVVNLYIDILWEQQDFYSKFVTIRVDTWLSARMQQCLGKQALEIVKSQRKKKKKTKPIFNGTAFNLDSRFVNLKCNSNNSFDIWIRFSSLGNKLSAWFPAKAHKHFNKFKDWTKSKSIRLIKKENNWFVEIFFEKLAPENKKTGKVIGVDLGYKKLLITSENQILDNGLEQVYGKISRKKQGSIAFKKSLIERNNLINQSLNGLNLSNVKELICEDLKNVKYKSKGKIRKKFNSKLQRWSYVQCLDKLSHMAEESGTLFTKVNPAYTSQKCSRCGVIRKLNRKGEIYKCACGNIMDADLNASKNISFMGVYSPHALY